MFLPFTKNSIYVIVLFFSLAAVNIFANYTTDPATVYYRLLNNQSMYKYIQGTGENGAGDLVFGAGGFYGAYPKEDGYTHSSLYFCKFDDTGLLIEPYIELTDPDNNFLGPRMVWTGQVFGLAYSSQYKAKFRLVSPAGAATAPVELPKNIYTVLNPLASINLVQVAAMKPVWTGANFLVFGLLLEPTFDSGQHYAHLCVWNLDAQGNLISAREIKNIYGLIYEKYRGSEHGWFNVEWSGNLVFLAYFAWDGILPTTMYQMLDYKGDAVAAERRAYVSDVAIMTPMLAWNGSIFALTGYATDIQSSVSTYYIRFFDAAGNPTANEAIYNQGDPTFIVHNSVSWLGDKFVAAYPTINMTTFQAIIKLVTFNAAGQLLQSSYPMIAIGDSTIDFNWFQLGTGLKLVGDGKRVLVQGRFYHLIEQKFTPLIYGAAGDTTTPAPPVIFWPPNNKVLPANSPIVFQWRPVPSANNYHIQISDNSGFTKNSSSIDVTEQFSSILFEQDITNATYISVSPSGINAPSGKQLYWRVKGSNSSYTPAQTFTLTGSSAAPKSIWALY